MTAEGPLLRPPRPRADEDKDRRATWFEVFFYLVFVVVISQLASGLVADPGFAGLGRFAGLFVPLWWAWVVFTYYSDRFDTDDLTHRLLMLGGSAPRALRWPQPRSPHPARSRADRGGS